MGKTNPDIIPYPPPRKPDIAALSQLAMGRVLRPLVYLATFVSAYLHTREFFFPEFILRYNPDEAYVVILAAYAGHREVRRWSNDPQVISQTARRGEYFVVGWWTAYFVSVLIANQTPLYRVPDGLESLCMQITAVFFGTVVSQHLYKTKERQPGIGSSSQPLEDRILARLADAREPLKRRDLEAMFHLSRSVVQRMMSALESKGLVQWVGATRNDPGGGFVFKHKNEGLPKEG